VLFVVLSHGTRCTNIVDGYSGQRFCIDFVYRRFGKRCEHHKLFVFA